MPPERTDEGAGGEFRWVTRARPPGNGESDDPGGVDDPADPADPEDPEEPPGRPAMTTGLRAVCAVFWVGSAFGLGVAAARLVGVSAALLGSRPFAGALAKAAVVGLLGAGVFGFGLLAVYWVAARDRRGLGAALLYLVALGVAGPHAVGPPAGYLALAAPAAGVAELAYNRRRGYFDPPAVTPGERVAAALDEADGTDTDADDDPEEPPGRHPRLPASGDDDRPDWRRL